MLGVRHFEADKSSAHYFEFQYLFIINQLTIIYRQEMKDIYRN